MRGENSLLWKEPAGPHLWQPRSSPFNIVGPESQNSDGAVFNGMNKDLKTVAKEQGFGALSKVGGGPQTSQE